MQGSSVGNYHFVLSCTNLMCDIVERILFFNLLRDCDEKSLSLYYCMKSVRTEMVTCMDLGHLSLKTSYLPPRISSFVLFFLFSNLGFL